ncbi:MAG: hypothetical protein KGL26_01410 [Pseudomonadota bacterium]|nr:hypothetical protein [Pseudomonadota bacterium]
MSSGKFAAMTADLLARKGAAAPSVIMPVMSAPRPTLVARDEKPAMPQPPPFPQDDLPERPRRIMVSMTQSELEKLGIAAIKTGTSRHDIVRGALDEYFRKLANELPRSCACMEGGLCRC